MKTGYELVTLANGVRAVRSLAHGETFHPVIGPAAEAESLYVNQLAIRERAKAACEEFVIWDVGLGAAANALTVLKATRDLPCPIRLVSFDQTAAALEFALRNAEALGYFGGFENHVAELLSVRCVTFQNGRQAVNWQLCLDDFPTWLARFVSLAPRGTSGERVGVRGVLADSASSPQPSPPLGEEREKMSSPHAILFDPCSPRKNPEMWTLPLFINLFRLLDPQRPCALATYSRSTMTRAALLLAGFFVGIGRPVGQKEETTIAANTLDLISEPLDERWLKRAHTSHSAEPLRDSDYRQMPLSETSWEKLQAHPQFHRR